MPHIDRYMQEAVMPNLSPLIPDQKVALRAGLALVAIMFSCHLTAGTLETFTLSARLISVSGPAKAPSIDPYCRVGGEIVGATENWGSVTLTYDESNGSASLAFWNNGTGVTAYNNKVKNIFVASFSFQDSGSNSTADGYSSSFSESIRASYINIQAPSFRGSYVDRSSTTNLSTGKTAQCEFKYQLWGGTGDVPQDSNEPYDPSVVNIITEKLKSFIKDDTKSKNVSPVTKSACLCVRG